jgi:hypothetical protein
MGAGRADGEPFRAATREEHRFPIHVTRQHAAIPHVTGWNSLLQVRSGRTLLI